MQEQGRGGVDGFKPSVLFLCQDLSRQVKHSRLLCGVRNRRLRQVRASVTLLIDGTSFSSGKVSTEPSQLQSHAFELSSSAPNQTSLANPQRCRRATGKSELSSSESRRRRIRSLDRFLARACPAPAGHQRKAALPQ
jgi:hypothetical protein